MSGKKLIEFLRRITDIYICRWSRHPWYWPKNSGVCKHNYYVRMKRSWKWTCSHKGRKCPPCLIWWRMLRVVCAAIYSLRKSRVKMRSRCCINEAFEWLNMHNKMLTRHCRIQMSWGSRVPLRMDRRASWQVRRKETHACTYRYMYVYMYVYKRFFGTMMMILAWLESRGSCVSSVVFSIFRAFNRCDLWHESNAARPIQCPRNGYNSIWLDDLFQ